MMYYHSSRDGAEDPESTDDRLLGPSGGGGDEPNPNGDAWKGAGRLGLQLMQIGYQVLALLLDHSLYCWHIYQLVLLSVTLAAEPNV
jgi:hypothetical protein